MKDDLFYSVRSIIDRKIVLVDIFSAIATCDDNKSIQIGNAVINLQTEQFNANFSIVFFESEEKIRKTIKQGINDLIPQLKRTLNV